MNWLMQFFSSPARSLLLSVGMVLGGIVLLVAILHSPHGASVLGGMLAMIPLLVMMRMPMRFIMRLAVGAFVILGVVSLAGELVASGVLVLLMLVVGLVVLGLTLRWLITARQGLPPVRRHRIGRW
jgi:hypothetical protein